ncbi:winged helix-turn-helix domain-containing protein [Flavitalea sp.]|nr:winged helix-turn-helix domain-containing protein [Flavitalea sp.]
MRVNSAFAGFFLNRLVVWSIVMPAIFFITSSFTDHSDRDIRVKQMNIVIRQLGHRLLLQAGDSTSRVMPVTETKKGTFQLRFENDFIFNHDSLMALSKGLLPKAQFPSGYTVTVHDCKTGGIIYGFQLNNNSPDMLACSGRSQPAGCYTIEFAFPDFYVDAIEKKADVDQLTEPVYVEPKEVNAKREELKATSSSVDIDQQTGEPKLVKANPGEVNPKLKDIKTTTVNYPSINMVYGGMLVLFGIALLIGRYGKRLKPVSVPNQGNAILQDHAIIEESVPELPSLGKFLFNAKDQHLLLGSELISLTDKECKVLELLHNNFGELIPRETLMDEVWLKEGVITGRSLDMFVSKLRKKLSPDPELRITNVHGKGYKLEIPEP